MLKGGFGLHERCSKEGPKAVGLRDVEREFEREECEVVDGKVPEWIFGSMYHQSGGAFANTTDVAFLDGLAHIDAYHFDGTGRVLFSNKYLRTKDFKSFIEKGERNWEGTAQQPKMQTGFGKMISKFGDLFRSGTVKSYYNGFNPNVTSWILSKSTEEGQVRICAATEADGEVVEYDPNTLDTLRSVKTLPASGMVITNAAHWFFDHDNAGGYHVGLDLKWKMAGLQPEFTFKYVLWFGAEPPFSKVYECEIAKFKWNDRAKQDLKQRASYMHTIAQTRNHVIVVCGSKKLRYESILGNDMKNGFFGLFDSEDVPVEFMVFKIVNKETGQVEYVDTIAASNDEKTQHMLWHLSNCFEQDGRIVIDSATALRAFGMPKDQFELDFQKEPHGLVRFEIDLTKKQVSMTRLVPFTDSEQHEFPNINPKFHLKDYQFVYMLENPLMPDSKVVMGDVKNGKSWYLEGLDRHEIPSEPLFIANPDGEDELDGIVITEVVNTEKDASYLLLCEPTSEDGLKVICRVKAPMTTNLGLHCTWVDHNLTQLAAKY